MTVPVHTLSTVADLVMVNGVALLKPSREAMSLGSLQTAETAKVFTPMIVSLTGLYARSSSDCVLEPIFVAAPVFLSAASTAVP